MTNDLLMRALRSEPTPRRPVWVMRQAGRYLPEYRELRARYTFEELVADPELAAKVTMMPIERFGFDAAIIFADLMSPLAALGVSFRFDPGPVIAEPVRDRARIRSLRVPPREEIAPEVQAALRIVKQELGGRAALLGFAGAPLSLAAYLVEGRGRRGFPRLRAMAAADPAALGELLDVLAELAAEYAIAQAAAGADAVQIFDSWAGILPPRTWRELVEPRLRALLEALGRAGVPRILFLHQAPHLVEPCSALPCEALAVDWMTDLAELRRKLGPERPVQGNLDPAVLLAGPEATRRATERLLREVPARGHIVNLGHGITPDAPLESVEALVETVHAEHAAAAAGEEAR